MINNIIISAALKRANLFVPLCLP